MNWQTILKPTPSLQWLQSFAGPTQEQNASPLIPHSLSYENITLTEHSAIINMLMLACWPNILLYMHCLTQRY